MNELLEKYAEVLLNTCLKVDKNKPLFISANTEAIEFIRVVANKAYNIGITDIYFDITDPYLMHDALKNLEIKDLKKLTFWNREMWNVYAKKDAAFLMLVSKTPGLMKDIEAEKLTEMTKFMYETRKEFDALRAKSSLAWCIAAVPTKAWAKVLFKDATNPTNELWNKIFEICSIKEENPVEIWERKINKLEKRSAKLNEYKFKKLHYTSTNKTNFTIELPEKHIWQSGKERLSNGKDVLVNFPTEEVFTSPDCMSANGIVYSSKPLCYQDTIIDEFSITFKNGKAVDCSAKEGEETLKSMINICKNANMLGEVALVPYSSPISNSNLVFLETLYDENAACHLALGDSFPECFENGVNMTKEELFKKNLNHCKSHVDFMIGTKNLSIIGTTHDGRKIEIFKDGNFTEEFN